MTYILRQINKNQRYKNIYIYIKKYTHNKIMRRTVKVIFVGSNRFSHIDLSKCKGHGAPLDRRQGEGGRIKRKCRTRCMECEHVTKTNSSKVNSREPQDAVGIQTTFNSILDLRDFLLRLSRRFVCTS